MEVQETPRIVCHIQLVLSLILVYVFIVKIAIFAAEKTLEDMEVLDDMDR